MTDWYNYILKADKSCLIQNNLRKIHYLFEDGKEMVEEYNTDTKVLTRRAWRTKNELGNEGDWDIEIGDPEPSCFKTEQLIVENSTQVSELFKVAILHLIHLHFQPFVTRRITRTNLEWRIRNLPYPIDTYTVMVEKTDKCLVVRTTNKKYYKKLVIPELDRLNLLPQQENVQFSHKFNTLVITVSIMFIMRNNLKHFTLILV